ncbi:hypothetical protein B296_00029544 [Ensete ventricosum]|uniref:Uncharacterized protein n=1 Tax=Ensete ventricosum TaxID=4639 RepID=A0A426YT23_ENSVE|nr:hypothetical protein B296_00029544 [Ensete ventricosum]
MVETAHKGQPPVTSLRQGLPKAGSSLQPSYRGSHLQGRHLQARCPPKLRAEAAHRSARKSDAHGGVVLPAGTTPTAKAVAPAP